MTGQALTTTSNVSPAIPRQVDTDAQLIGMWISSSHSPHARRARTYDAQAFLEFVQKPLGLITARDVMGYSESITGAAPATRGRRISHVKSLLSFAHRLGVIAFNPGAVVKVPAIKNVLAERIIDEASVHQMIANGGTPRNRLIVRLLYAAGLRASELAGLAWKDAVPRDDAGQLTVMGKGGKTRVVLLSAATWRDLQAHRNGAGNDDLIFMSRTGHALDTSAIHRVIKAVAKRAGIDAGISAHWLRHAHASHALDRGCPIHVLKDTLGHASVATTSRYLHARPNDGSGKYLAI